MRILLLSRYHEEAASSRVRFYQYLPYLRQQGMSIKITPFFYDGYVPDRFKSKIYLNRTIADFARRLFAVVGSSHFDLLWIQGELFPKAPAILERLLALFGKNYVVDYDDAIFSYYEDSKNPLFSRILRHKIDVVMRKAKLVIAGNEFLAQRARNAGAKWVEILPSVVDLGRYPPRSILNHDENTFTIGWIGSPITAQFLLPLTPVFETITKAASVSVPAGVRIKLIGSGEITFHKVIPEIVEWNPQTEVSELQSLDVGIMPLQEDHPLAPWKCGYKIIQYFAAGIPVVASPVGVNTKIVCNGENGYLADSPEEWIDALQKMREDRLQTAKMGQAGRKLVENEYCLPITAPKLISLFENLEVIDQEH